MTNNILFQVKIQGTFTREGFTANDSVKPMTITKFADGSFVAKAGNKIIKNRFSTNKGFANLLSENLGINL
jgi:hypothetical protein